MFVSDILKTKGFEIVTLTGTESVTEALAMINQHRIGAVLIMTERGEIAGILSERDLVRAMHRFGREVFDKTVSELMTAPVVTCSPRDPIAAIMGMMTAQRFRHVPVIEGDRLIGLISIGDVVKSHIEEAQAEVDALRRYISL